MGAEAKSVVSTASGFLLARFLRIRLSAAGREGLCPELGGVRGALAPTLRGGVALGMPRAAGVALRGKVCPRQGSGSVVRAAECTGVRSGARGSGPGAQPAALEVLGSRDAEGASAGAGDLPLGGALINSRAAPLGFSRAATELRVPAHASLASARPLRAANGAQPTWGIIRGEQT